MNATPSSIGWQAPQNWPNVSGLSRKELMDYARITFNYEPATKQNWVIPYTAVREKKILAAVSPRKPAYKQAEDWLLKYYSLKKQYSRIHAADNAKLKLAEQMFDCATKALSDEAEGQDLSAFSQEYIKQLRANGFDAKADVLSVQMAEANKKALSVKSERRTNEYAKWFQLAE